MVRIGQVKMTTFYTVVYDECAKSGKLIRKKSDFVEDLTWFRARIEKRGGTIVSESGPRQVESISVGF